METFDEYDQGILSERQRARHNHPGVIQGDYIRRADGLLTRVTDASFENAQTLGYGDNGFTATGDGGSFSLGASGHMSYSGSLSSGVPLSHLRDTGERRKARAWFFHHGQSGAHRGVDCEVFVRVWELLDDSKAVRRDIPARYIIDTGAFRGSIQSSTYTTYDGVERVAYNDGLSLKDYMAGGRGLGVRVVNGDELDAYIKQYHDSMKTNPEPITLEHHDHMLECLPPCRYQVIRGASVFHVSERLTGNLVQWCFRVGDKCWGFTEDAAISTEALAGLIDGAVKKAA